MPLNSPCPTSQSAGMFVKFQNAFDKVGLFLQDGGRSIGFRRRMSMTTRSSKVQSIYDLCKTTFTPSVDPPPSSQSIQKLCSLLDAVGPSVVGLKEENSKDDDSGYGLFRLNNLNRVARWAQPITYLDVHECASFTNVLSAIKDSEAATSIIEAWSAKIVGWTSSLMGFYFTKADGIATKSIHDQRQLPLIFQFLYLSVLLGFSCLLLAEFVKFKSPVPRFFAASPFYPWC